MKLLIIILNYKTTRLTIDCLRSLLPELVSFAGTSVTVVENGSGPGAEQELRDAIKRNGWESRVQLISLDRNLGFTGGNNLAIERALQSSDRPQYILLLNSDTLVRSGAIAALVRFMDEHPTAGIAGSRLESPSGAEQGSPFRFHGIVSELDRGLAIGLFSRIVARWIVYSEKPSEAAPVDWVAGAGMILRTKMVDQVGLLDNGYFAYYEDMDYCLSARRLGWQTWYVPESRIVHLEGASSGIRPDRHTRPPAYWFQARRRYFMKNHGALYTILTDAALVFACGVGSIYAIIRRRKNGNSLLKLKDSFRHSIFVAGWRA